MASTGVMPPQEPSRNRSMVERSGDSIQVEFLMIFPISCVLRRRTYSLMVGSPFFFTTSQCTTRQQPGPYLSLFQGFHAALLAALLLESTNHSLEQHVKAHEEAKRENPRFRYLAFDSKWRSVTAVQAFSGLTIMEGYFCPGSGGIYCGGAVCSTPRKCGL